MNVVLTDFWDGLVSGFYSRVAEVAGVAAAAGFSIKWHGRTSQFGKLPFSRFRR